MLDHVHHAFAITTVVHHQHTVGVGREHLPTYQRPFHLFVYSTSPLVSGHPHHSFVSKKVDLIAGNFAWVRYISMRQLLKCLETCRHSFAFLIRLVFPTPKSPSTTIVYSLKIGRGPCVILGISLSSGFYPGLFLSLIPSIIHFDKL